VKRLIDEYFVTHKEASSVFDVELLLERIQRDTILLGEDGETLDGTLKRLLGELTKMRAAQQTQLRKDDWSAWKAVLEAIRKNPLSAVVRFVDNRPVINEPTAGNGTAPSTTGGEAAPQSPATVGAA
jgi:hypothetical protein